MGYAYGIEKMEDVLKKLGGQEVLTDCLFNTFSELEVPTDDDFTATHLVEYALYSE